jgi:hypothetical protein
MGFKVALSKDPLLWIVFTVNTASAAYQSIRRAGAWALADFVLAFHVLGSLAGWART